MKYYKCENCSYWKRDKVYNSVESCNDGDCCRFPPLTGKFSKTKFNQWCGEHDDKDDDG